MKKLIRIFFTITFILLCHESVFADDFSDAGSQGYLYNSWNNLMNELGVVIGNVMVDPNLVFAANTFFVVFAITLIVITMFHFTNGRATYGDLIALVLLIGMTKVLMLSYDFLTSGIWEWFVGLANGIQNVATGTEEPAQIPMWVAKVATSIVVKESANSWFMVSVAHLFAAGTVYLFALLLSVMAFLASAWAVWGYAIAKLIGWFFIPFIMFERLSFIFDGWLRFFLGFVVYALVARINILLMAIALKVYFGLVTVNYNPAVFVQPIEVTADAISDIAGMAGLMFIGILALLSTGSFAASIIGGATGFGNGIRAIASAARGLK